MNLELNQSVVWDSCPGSISAFSTTRIRGLSPCGRFALLDWISHPVPIETLKPCPLIKFFKNYKPVSINQWGDDHVDIATQKDLKKWVSDYEQRSAFLGGSPGRK